MISPGARYRVLSPLLTVRKYGEARGFFTVPPGAIVETAGDLQTAGLVPIRVFGELLLAFSRDLHERSQVLQAASIWADDAEGAGAVWEKCAQ
jgi:hypothetical protein